MKILKLLPVFLLLFAGKAYSDTFSSQVRLKFVNNGTLAVDEKLVFGANTNATDGRDADFGELRLPPMPPPGFELFVAFELDDDWSYTDIRGVPEEGNEFQHRYKIVLFKRTTDAVTISWEALPVNIKSAVIADKLGGVLFSADMKSQNSVTINNDVLEKIEINLDVVYEKTQTSAKDDNNKNMIYPNPSSNYIHLYNIDEIKSIEIFNQVGERLVNINQVSSAPIDISNLLNGIYYIKILNNDNTTTTDKFIKIDN